MLEITTYIDTKKTVIHINLMQVSYLKEIRDDWNFVKGYMRIMSDGSTFEISKEDGDNLLDIMKFNA